ncbi:CPBP family intramembrane metalloprotease [Streptomonospora nanhaiensis]|uniref:CPBP family intramembrane metalloprotease n=1 Tax=Streptomonospora nanhaiensis TaxID=1323731 RepID=A0ABY6YHI5_9ACTN|nr:CPBP family intramembrane glutamic endopeptidase [Streptomonospora nanhaiensis]WAE71728.1 CPBP family intramembrane metalloprotease [Streptomonospora nanhaiensis]
MSRNDDFSAPTTPSRPAVPPPPTSRDGNSVETPPPPRRRGPRPVPPGVEYHRVLADDKRRIGRGILAIVLLVGGLFAFNILIAVAAAFVDAQAGRTNPTLGGTDYTPLYHAANLASVALLIPWSMLLQRWLYGVKGASLHSVVSSFRLDVFGRAFLIIGPLWLLLSLVGLYFMPMDQAHWSSTDLIAVFTATLLLAPLQSAGEEYGFRGLVFRVAAGWGRGPRTALVLGVLVSSLVFTVVHLSTDPWFNIWCFSLSVSLALITWRTGGIEIAVVIHALNNTLTFLLLTVLHADQNPALERSAGSQSAALLIPCLVLVVITAVVWLRTRRTGPVLTPSDPPTAREGRDNGGHE